MSKKLFLLLPAALLAAVMFFTPSCNTDACKNVECGANGVCLDGTCACDAGYEGTGCADEWATKFLGTYTGTDGCGGNLTKPVTVTRLSPSTVRITNFGGFDSYVDATIELGNGATTAEVISLNNYLDPAARKFSGTGTISGNTINISYVVTYSDNTTESCTFVISK